MLENSQKYKLVCQNGNHKDGGELQALARLSHTGWVTGDTCSVLHYFIPQLKFFCTTQRSYNQLGSDRHSNNSPYVFAPSPNLKNVGQADEGNIALVSRFIQPLHSRTCDNL